MSMKVLKPSSMKACRRSFDPTIIGNQPCPISCAVTQNRNDPLSGMPSNTTPGYSIPVENPATLTATGHGYGNHCFEKCSTVSFTYSVDLSHASAPTLSGGYTLIASAFFPSGRLIRAASHTKTGDALHTTSRVWSMWKCHVSVPSCFGRLAGSVTSAGLRIYTVASLFRACGQPLYLRLRQHILRILQLTRSRNDHVRRHRH